MVETIKFCTWAMVIALFVGSFSSCSEKGIDVDSIIGKWQIFYNSTYDDFDPCELEEWIEFQSGGNFRWYDACDDSMETGTWSIKKKKYNRNG